MKTTLILSFIFVVCVLSAPVAIVQANEQEAVPEFSVSINAPAQKSNSGEKYEKNTVLMKAELALCWWSPTQWLDCLRMTMETSITQN